MHIANYCQDKYILLFVYTGSLSPELAVLKAIAEEQKDMVKRSSAEPLPSPEISYMYRRSRSLTTTAAKHAKARLTVERVINRARELAGNVDLPELAFFPMLEFAQCVDITRAYNCSAPSVNMYRTADGSCNNIDQPLQGASNTAFRRMLPAQYEDGIYIPVGYNQAVNGNPFSGPWPSARRISRLIARDLPLDSSAINMIFTLFGQFLALDFTRFGEFETQECAQSCDLVANLPFCNPIPVEPFDPVYGKRGPNQGRCLFITRAVGECMQPFNSTFSQGRQQINQITHYLDASMVYGNNAEEAAALRSFKGGCLKQGDRFGPFKGNLPFSPVPSPSGVPFFAAGDIRVDNYVHQTIMVTLWVRQHNYIVDQLSKLNPCWDDERLYQEGRKIVGAILQVIIYQEYLPLLFGDQFDAYIGEYTGYDAMTDATVPMGFAVGAMRFGHSMFTSSTDRLDGEGNMLPIGALGLRESFFNPLEYFISGGTDPLLRGMLRSRSRELDEFVSRVLTTQLFPLPGEPLGMDLASRNIQRGREHGIPSYRDFQKYCSSIYGTRTKFMRPFTAARLRAIYGPKGFSDGIDLWVGGLAEDKLEGSNLGSTFACILGETFSDLRSGDRFYWENPDMFTDDQRETLSKMTIAKLICENADNIPNITPRAFEFGLDEVTCDSLPSVDLSYWKDPTCLI